MQGGHESSARRKTSKYFSSDNQKLKDEKEVEEPSAKRKFQKGSGELSSEAKPSPGKKLRKVDDDNDDDFVLPNSRKASDEVTPSKKLKSSSGRGISKKSVDTDESDEDDADGANTRSSLKSAGRARGGKSAASSAVGMNIDEDDEDEADKKPVKSSGRGRGGRGGASAAPAGGRGRGGGGGRGGFMNFGERKDPPHKGEKVLELFLSDLSVQNKDFLTSPHFIC